MSKEIMGKIGILNLYKILNFMFRVKDNITPPVFEEKFPLIQQT